MDTAARADAATGGGAESLDVIVVTAERRTVDIQKSASAANVLTGYALQDSGVTTVNQLQFVSSSLTIGNFGFGNEINIRGVGKSDFRNNFPSGIVTYRDGFPVFGSYFQDEPFYDIESVEVLRGPQGTFAGRDATGGAIFINEVNPSLTDGYTGYLTLQGGNYSNFGGQGAINIPVSDTFAMRLAFDVERRDTFFDVSGPYSGDTDYKGYSARASFLWQPTSSFKALLKLDGNYIARGHLNCQAVGPSSCLDGDEDEILNVSTDANLRGLDRFYRAVARLEYTFDNGLLLRSISGYTKGRADVQIDADGTSDPVPIPAPNEPGLPGPGGFAIGPSVFSTNFPDRLLSEEINLVSPEGGRTNWLLGAFFGDEATAFPAGSGYNYILFVPAFGIDVIQNVVTDTTKRTYAGFGQVGFKITDALELQAGLRYSHGKAHTTATTTNIPPTQPPRFSDVRISDSRVTEKVSLNWNVSESSFLYAYVASGHKGGGVNANGTPYGDENVRTFEIGWKSNFFDDHLRLQVNGFYEKYKGFQVSVFDPDVHTTLIENAAGTTRISGVELQAQAVFNRLGFDLNLAPLRTRLDDWCPGDSRFSSHPIVCVKDNELPNAPDFTANLGIRYRFQVGPGATLTPRIDYSYVGKQWASIFHQPIIDELDTRSIVNAQITYDAYDWRVQLYSTNLFDDRYVGAIFGNTLVVAGAPRQYGLRITRTF